jgi:hypothetical protein
LPTDIDEAGTAKRGAMPPRGQDVPHAVRIRRKAMSFVVNNREYQKPRRVRSWTAVGVSVAMIAALVALSVRIWF